MAQKNYRWKAPVAYEGDRVRFDNFGRSTHNATVVRVETHYKKNGEAYHIYAVLPDGWCVRRYVGGENIIAHI